MTDPRPAFVCPYCQRVSHHPQDVANRYCACCGSWPYLLKDCPHVSVEEAHRSLLEQAKPPPVE